jgi:hypothetical protein
LAGDLTGMQHGWPYGAHEGLLRRGRAANRLNRSLRRRQFVSRRRGKSVNNGQNGPPRRAGLR